MTLYEHLLVAVKYLMTIYEQSDKNQCYLMRGITEL